MPLIGCGSGSMRDLETYAQEVLERKHQAIEPLPTFEPYEVYAYASKEARNPFEPFSQDAQRLTEKVDTGSGIQPVPHTPEELEQFPLDSLRMVGTLDKAEQVWGIILDKEGTVYRVLKGNYMGKNNGKVIHIFEDRIELTEIIPNGTGGWQERQAALALAE
jgi:type IV pilus assembly protein PilP